MKKKKKELTFFSLRHMGRDPCREREDHYHRHKCAFPASGALLKKPPSPSPHHHLPPAKSVDDDHAKIPPRLAVCTGSREIFAIFRLRRRPDRTLFLFGRPPGAAGFFLLSLSPRRKWSGENIICRKRRRGGSPYIREISHGQERGDDDKCSVFMQVGKRKEGEG